MRLKTLSSENHEHEADAATANIVGRSFVLGLPDTQGAFHIGLHNQLWRIAPGAYQAGDRVQVVTVEHDRLVVQACLHDAARPNTDDRSVPATN